MNEECLLSYLFFSAVSLSFKYDPTTCAFSWRFSFSITLKTASPAAVHTGFPPKVLKKLRRVRTFAISGVVTTAPRGIPFPMPCRYQWRKSVKVSQPNSNKMVHQFDEAMVIWIEVNGWFVKSSFCAFSMLVCENYMLAVEPIQLYK